MIAWEGGTTTGPGFLLTVTVSRSRLLNTHPRIREELRVRLAVGISILIGAKTATDAFAANVESDRSRARISIER
jgi:hypothetical protein